MQKKKGNIVERSLQRFDWRYLFPIAVVVIYFRQTGDIINTPIHLNLLLGVVITLFFSFFYFRWQKWKAKQTDARPKDWADRAIDGATIVVFSFFLFLTVKIPINYYIISYAKQQPVTTAYFDIVSSSTRQRSKKQKRLKYTFIDGKSYWLEYSNKDNIDKKELKEDYQISLSYSKSVLGIFVRRSHSVSRK